MYKVNSNKKTIIIDDVTKLTENEKKEIKFYNELGYTVTFKHKTNRKIEVKPENKLTDKEIRKALENNHDKLAEYDAIKDKKGKGGGFLSARKWYIENFMEKTESKKKNK